MCLCIFLKDSNPVFNSVFVIFSVDLDFAVMNFPVAIGGN